MPSPDLAELQTGLRDLIKRRRALTPDDHPYLHYVAASPRLILVRDIAEWWRTSALTAAVPLTMAVLERSGILGREVSRFTAHPDWTPIHVPRWPVSLPVSPGTKTRSSLPSHSSRPRYTRSSWRVAGNVPHRLAL